MCYNLHFYFQIRWLLGIYLIATIRLKMLNVTLTLGLKHVIFTIYTSEFCYLICNFKSKVGTYILLSVLYIYLSYSLIGFERI